MPTFDQTDEHLDVLVSQPVVSILTAVEASFEPGRLDVHDQSTASPRTSLG